MTSRNFETKISNCDVCNQISQLRRLQSKWICSNCIIRINTMIKQFEKANKTEELLEIMKRNFEPIYEWSEYE